MTRRMLILVAAILFLLVAPPAIAQVPGYPSGCSTCAVYGYMDGLEPTDVPVADVTQLWTIPGWGFECYSGRPVDRVVAYYRADDGYFKPASTSITDINIERPDVRAAYQAYCPAVSSITGIAVTVAAHQIPPGVRDVAFVMWRGYLPSKPLYYRVRFQ